MRGEVRVLGRSGVVFSRETLCGSSPVGPTSSGADDTSGAAADVGPSVVSWFRRPHSRYVVVNASSNWSELVSFEINGAIRQQLRALQVMVGP